MLMTPHEYPTGITPTKQSPMKGPKVICYKTYKYQSHLRRPCNADQLVESETISMAAVPCYALTLHYGLPQLSIVFFQFTISTGKYLYEKRPTTPCGSTWKIIEK